VSSDAPLRIIRDALAGDEVASACFDAFHRDVLDAINRDWAKIAALERENARLRAALEGLSKPVPYPDERWRPACIDCAESQRFAREALAGAADEVEGNLG
jgi:hypothetical protein